jgi:hypothetical protein
MEEEYYRVKKYNGGAGSINCSECSVILKEGFLGNTWAEAVHKKMGTYPDGLITKEDWASDEPMFCKSCTEELKNENKNLKSSEKQ